MSSTKRRRGRIMSTKGPEKRKGDQLISEFMLAAGGPIQAGDKGRKELVRHQPVIIGSPSPVLQDTQQEEERRTEEGILPSIQKL